MKRLILTILFAFFLAENALATTFYVDCNANGDAGAGTGTGAAVAWKTINMVNTSTFSAGDSILFNRTCTWNEKLTVPSSGSVGSPITFGAYGTGAKPIIDKTPVLPGWNTTGNWTNYGGQTAAFFGNTSTSAPAANAIDNAYWLTAGYACPGTGSRTLNELSVYAIAKNGSANAAIRLGLFTTAGALVAQGSASVQVTNTSDGWVGHIGTSNLKPAGGNAGDPVTLTGGTSYLIVISEEAGASPWDEAKFGYETTANLGSQINGGGDKTAGYDSTISAGNSTNSVFHVRAGVAAVSSNVWSFSYDYFFARVFLNGTEYFQATSKDTVDATHRWFYDSTGKLLYLYATSNPATFYSSIQLSTATWYDSTISVSKDYVTLDNLDVRGNYEAIDINGSNHINISNSIIGYRALKGVYFRGTNSYINIFGSTVESGIANIAEPWPPGITGGYGDGIITDGASVTSYLNVYNNTVSNWDHSQINFTGTSGSTTHSAIYNNTLTAPNTNYGRGFEFTGTADNAVRDNVAYNNYLYNLATSAIGLNGNNNSVYYNIIDTVRTNIGTSTYNGGIYLATNPSKICHDNAVYNNVIYNVANHGIWFQADATHANSTNLIKNNIIMNWGTYGGDTFYAIASQDAYTGSQTFANNMFYKSAVTAVAIWAYGGTTYTAAAFDAASGAAWTASGDRTADPLFINAGTDFHLQAASPAKWTGVNVSLTTDYAGKAVHNPPSMGAYEVQATGGGGGFGFGFCFIQ